MTNITIIVDASDIQEVYKIAHKFICFLDIYKSDFKGCKEVSFTVANRDACLLQELLAKAELV